MKKPDSRTPKSFFQSGWPFMSSACRPSDPRNATMRSPSVASVEFACVAFVWRFTAGMPRWSSRSHRTEPDPLVDAYDLPRFRRVVVRPARCRRTDPSFRLCSPSLVAVLTQARSPQTIGLEWPSPAIGRLPFHALTGRHAPGGGVLLPSPRPLASMPRKEGQSTPGRGARAAETRPQVRRRSENQAR